MEEATTAVIVRKIVLDENREVALGRLSDGPYVVVFTNRENDDPEQVVRLSPEALNALVRLWNEAAADGGWTAIDTKWLVQLRPIPWWKRMMRRSPTFVRRAR